MNNKTKLSLAFLMTIGAIAEPAIYYIAYKNPQTTDKEKAIAPKSSQQIFDIQ